ncbi:hypothetical protein [Phytoactinopolyspora endophytica]|uniref:hypothetical protein n=1 Tax=Phytoactinopolyspora endophytica TaxID=1642495 RepID=UPI00101C70E4|nr:hypothetical protein [Phytoactinopolyspora endophytica]
MSATSESMRAVGLSVWAGQRVDLAQQYPGQFGVVVIDPAGHCLDERGVLASRDVAWLAAGLPAQVAFAPIFKSSGQE